jgi:putative hydrolase of the HAD superfamily
MAIRAILFDMGNTLIDFESRPACELHRTAVDAVHDRLGEMIPGELPSRSEFQGQMEDAWTKLEARHRSRTSQPTLAEAIRIALEPISHALTVNDVSELELAHYQVIRAQIRLYPEVMEVLEKLSSRGLQLALISNTIWPTDLHREDLTALGLDRFFRSVIFSRDFGRMKPHPAIFRSALDSLGVKPEFAMVVGDRAGADIAGAHAVGCKAVLRIHPFTYDPDEPDLALADARIQSLTELFPLLDRF